VLRDRGDARRQAAGKANENLFDRCGTVVFRRKDLGMVGVKLERCPVALLFAKAEEAFDN
jgi:hypothetical protein